MQVLVAGQVAADDDQVQAALRLHLEARAERLPVLSQHAEAQRLAAAGGDGEGRGSDRRAVLGRREAERRVAHPGVPRLACRGGLPGVDGGSDCRRGAEHEREDGGEQAEADNGALREGPPSHDRQYTLPP